jgi:hypothetical protein
MRSNKLTKRKNEKERAKRRNENKRFVKISKKCKLTTFGY